MNSKKNLRNVLVSFLTVILFDVIYSIVGILVLEFFGRIGILTILFAVGLLGGLLYAGYLVGKKLCCNTKIRGVSIVLIPMVLLLMLFGIGIIEPSGIIGTLVQYPAVILVESLRFGDFFDNHSMLIYAILILYYLICCLSLLIGSYIKQKKEQHSEKYRP